MPTYRLFIEKVKPPENPEKVVEQIVEHDIDILKILTEFNTPKPLPF